MSEFYSKIAGVNAKNPDGNSRQKYIRAYAKPNAPLILRREPNNPYDKNAIAVFIKARAFIFFTSIIQIGYLNKDVAEELSKCIAKGGTVSGTIKEITGGKGKESLGVNVLLTKQNA